MSKSSIPAASVTTNRALLGVPLAVALVFSFGLVMTQHDSPATPRVIDSPSSATTKPGSSKASELQTTTQQAELPAVSVEDSNTAAATTATSSTAASPQNTSTSQATTSAPAVQSPSSAATTQPTSSSPSTQDLLNKLRTGKSALPITQALNKFLGL